MNSCWPQNSAKIALITLVLVATTLSLSFATTQQPHFTASQSSLVLTPEEQSWLNNHPSLTISLDENNPPMNFRLADGTFSGISVEYLRLIGKKIGMPIEFKGSTWDQALRHALDHEVDGIMTASAKEDRKAFLNFTEPYVTTPDALATRKDFTELESFSELDGMTIAVVQGSVRVSIARERCPNSTVLEVNSPEEGIKLLAEGKVAAFFDDLPVVQHAIENNLLTNLKIALLYYSGAGAVRVGLRNDSPELLSIFNKAIAAISIEEHRAIRNKWFASSAVAAIEHELKLTVEEKAWLKEHPVVTVATDPEWRPIEFLDSDGEFTGISIDYLRKIEKRLGIRFEIVKGSTWAELIEKAKERELDMFSCITDTPGREKYLLFTEPYLSFPGAIFTRNDAPYVGDLKELDGKRVAVVNGYAFHEFLANNHPGLELVLVESTATGLQMLEDGQVAAYVGNLLVASYYITVRGNISLKVAGETPYRNDLSFAARSDWPELTKIMQKALDSLSPEEKREIYKRWVSLSYSEQKLDKKLIAEIVALFIVVFACTLIIIQRRQLRVRKQTMLEISRRKAEFEAVFNAMTDALVMTDTERRIVLVNSGFSKIFGYTISEVKGHTTETLYADPDEYKKLGKKRFSQVADNDQPSYEMQYRRKDGSVFPGETIAVKVNDSPDTVIGFLGCIRDITERKQATDELVKYRDNLQALVDEQTAQLKEAHIELLKQERLATLGQLTATVSHELRNPLGTIKSALFLIDDCIKQKQPERATRPIELAERNIDRCVNIIEELNAYAREKELDLCKTNLNDWLKSTLDEILLPKELRTKLDLACDAMVCFDQEKLRQVIVNLVNNAVHALQDERSQGKDLLVSCRVRGEMYEICVGDNGIGMSEEVRAKMFEPLFSTKGFGLGLGMVIVKNIIEQHHGKVHIDSKAGKGTRVTLSLPNSLTKYRA